MQFIRFKAMQDKKKRVNTDKFFKLIFFVLVCLSLVLLKYLIK